MGSIFKEYIFSEARYGCERTAVSMNRHPTLSKNLSQKINPDNHQSKSLSTNPHVTCSEHKVFKYVHKDKKNHKNYLQPSAKNRSTNFPSGNDDRQNRGTRKKRREAAKLAVRRLSGRHQFFVFPSLTRKSLKGGGGGGATMKSILGAKTSFLLPFPQSPSLDLFLLLTLSLSLPLSLSQSLSPLSFFLSLPLFLPLSLFPSLSPPLSLFLSHFLAAARHMCSVRLYIESCSPH